MIRSILERSAALFRRNETSGLASAEIGAGLKVAGYPPRVRNAGRLIIGNNVKLASTISPIRLTTSATGKIVIGDDTYINTGASLYSGDLVEIGPSCLIGNECVLMDSNFHQVSQGGQASIRPIRLKENVWLALRVIVMPGVTIGAHSVVAAGSVVFEDIPPKQVWCGNPARYLRDVRADDGFRRRG